MANLYRRNRITIEGLKKAVSDGVITEEEYQTITGDPYDGAEVTV